LLQKGEEKSQKIRRAMAILAAQSTLLFFYSSLRDLGTEIDPLRGGDWRIQPRKKITAGRNGLGAARGIGLRGRLGR